MIWPQNAGLLKYKYLKGIKEGAHILFLFLNYLFYDILIA